MDVLLKHAEKLADHSLNGVYIPIRSRIAYMVSHGQSYASNGYAVRTQGIAKALKKHALDTLCFVRPGRPWELGAKKNAVGPETVVDGVRYIHSRWPNDRAPKGEKAHLEACVMRFTELFQIYRPSAVLAASDYIVGLPAWIAAKRLGLPFYNEVRGFWELSRAAREPGFENTPTFKVEAERDVFVGRQARKVFTLNQPMKDELAKRGLDTDKIIILPNGVRELPEIKHPDPVLRQGLGIDSDDIVLGYVGSFNPYEGLDTLIDACDELSRQGEKIKLLLVGDEQPVNEAVDAHKVLADNPWLIQVGRIPHEQVADYYALIDTIVIPRKKLPVCELVSPMKAAEALAYGKALVVSDVVPLVEYGVKYDDVVQFEAGNVGSLVIAIKNQILEGRNPGLNQAFHLSEDRISLLFEEFTNNNETEKPKTYSTSSTNDVFSFHLKKEVTWKRFDLKGDNLIRIFGKIKVINGDDKAGVVLVELFDKKGNKVSPDEVGLPKSEVFGGGFMYLKDTKENIDQLACLQTMREVDYLRLGFVIFHCMGDTKISVSELSVNSKKLNLESRNSFLKENTNKKARDFKVAIIADEFTYNSFLEEFKALPIEPDNWLEVFEAERPDVFFCESAWTGADSVKRPWKGSIYASINFRDENRKVLFSILEYCKKAAIPTVFWNKEDPTHHDDQVHNFVDTAKRFDFVFTTASECIESYKRNHGIKNVFSLPFASNPKLFNPTEVSERSDHVVFAGSWYANHEKRSGVMEAMLDRLIDDGFKLDIYDRFHGAADPLHKWPEKYNKFLLPSKPHSKMPGVYKSSIYGLNFNTVVESKTMFARRVFELMSSNTLVISNHSKGVEDMFGELVVYPDIYPDRLKKLSREEVNDLRNRGLHKVLGEHTYRQRWKTILTTIGLPFIDEEVTLTFIGVVKRKEEALSAISWYQQYGIKLKGSKLLLVTDSSMNSLDIANFYQDYNRFGITVTSCAHADKYAISGRYCPVQTSHFITLTPEVFEKPMRVEEALLHFQYMDNYPLVLERCFENRYKVKEVGGERTILDKSTNFINWLYLHRESKNFKAYLV
ncbi:glycosyltransferase [Microbulbifer variabilis]|uniref:glycosyltransferase n=1 Tax=Microbulbifer variabilis TaxID=266805 RepID=UPI001CFC7D93|nr:glycosyltransferase [Microbulbifer variabilis]